MNYKEINDFAAAICGIKPKGFVQPPDLKGLYELKTTIYGIDLDAYVEYEASSESSEFEPGWSESISLMHAFVRGVDIAALLSEDIVELLYKEAKEKLKEDAAESAISQYEATYEDQD